ncbi:MAG: hypothetical protein ABIR71_05620 [Chthoniobacterales bacterium]
MKFTILLCALVLATGFARAQAPTPVVIQAVPAAAAPAVPANQSAPSAAAALKVIQEMKAANEEIMKKQAATLQQLDELQKAAEQLKIYSKRG